MLGWCWVGVGLGWVGGGVGLGLGWGWGWGWVGVGPTGPKIHPVGWPGGWVGGCKSDYIATSVQPTGFSHRSECGNIL